ncbi:MAG: transketolase [Actinomycetales bacterium]|nr:transketolase [Actinomycetales bacterium]
MTPAPKKLIDLDRTLDWSADDQRTVDYLRALAADAVQKVGNGHPGTAMSLAPAAYLLFNKIMTHDPKDPQWLGRDRFVLSAGHSSLTLYSQLFLCGYPLNMDDLKSFRTLGSLAPGHPEFGHTVGVETTTGPLGQGLATAVGMAMSERFEAGLFPQAPFAHRVWVIASDGDLQEGISGEASSLAGTQKLGHLNVIWDDNRISIEGDTEVAFTENVSDRYRAYGWDVHEVDMAANGDVDVPALHTAMVAAANTAGAPSFIRMRTTIAWPAPHARGTAKSHGSALGDVEVAALKQELGLDPQESFAFDPALVDRVRAALGERTAHARKNWDADLATWRKEQAPAAALLDRLVAKGLPADLASHLPTYATGGATSTRKASGQVLNALALQLPEMWGGSADLAESNLTWINGSPSFLPDFSDTSSPYGRNIHFGIREHAMGAALNGIALDGLTKPFGGTFLVFSDYMRGSVRLAAFMQTDVTYVWSHDSIGLGEDGPTHQPVEHLWSLRAIPGLSVVRPADAKETAAAWVENVQRGVPVGLILSRQDLPHLDQEYSQIAAGVARGGYILVSDPDPQVIIIATGSEVSVALAARETLNSQGVQVQVVSMPCIEWFDQQSQDYRDQVLPPHITARVAVEAGATLGWYRFVGTSGEVVGLDHFGASASAPVLFTEFGITPAAVAAAALKAIEN